MIIYHLLYFSHFKIKCKLVKDAGLRVLVGHSETGQSFLVDQTAFVNAVTSGPEAVLPAAKETDTLCLLASYSVFIV